MKKLDREEVRIVKGDFTRAFKKQIKDEAKVKEEIEMAEMLNDIVVTKEDFEEAFEEIIKNENDDFYGKIFYQKEMPLSVIADYIEEKRK